MAEQLIIAATVILICGGAIGTGLFFAVSAVFGAPRRI